MLNLPPILPITDASLDLRLSAQIYRLGAAGFPWVEFCGEPLEKAQWEELSIALRASWANGGWPAISISDRTESAFLASQGGRAPWGLWLKQADLPPAVVRSQSGRPFSSDGLTMEDAGSCYQAGAEALAVGCELAGSPKPLEFLWQMQCLRWRCRPPFRRGQGVALIGGSGCGKSTLARELGDRLHLPVNDLDEAIVLRAGKSIARIFSEDGEPAFRDRETEITCEAFRSAAVLALGGGAWESEAVRKAARASGFAILWIAENPDRIWQRVGQDPVRPLAQERETFMARWRTRMPRWMEAPMVLPLGRSPSLLADALGESLTVASA